MQHRTTGRDILIRKEAAFVANYNGNQEEAALAAGYKHGRSSGNQLMKRPRVLAAIERKQAAMQKASGEKAGKLVSISNEKIIKITLGIAEDSATPPQARISALTLLAKIRGMIVNKTVDLTDRFAGWTEEEMHEYAVTGEYPERIRSQLRDGEPGCMPESSPETPIQ